MINFVRKLFYTLQSVARHPLNRRSKLRSIADFCLAQVAARVISGDLSVPFPNGTSLLISPKMKGAAHFISPGLCEFHEMAFVAHFLRPADLFVDIGANVGAYTLLASGVAGANTFAIEPSPAVFPYLKRNVLLNELQGKVRLLNAAAGARLGRLRLTQGLGTENHISTPGVTIGDIEVEVTALDAALAGSDPALLKIDVEGFESEVITGANAVLNNPSLQALIIERSSLGARYGFDEGILHRQIRERSFIPCAYSGIDRSLVQLSPDAQGNIIYVRDLPTVEARVRKGQAFLFRNTKV